MTESDDKQQQEALGEDTEEPGEESSSPTASRQQLVPIFALAVALMAFGFYEALTYDQKVPGAGQGGEPIAPPDALAGGEGTGEPRAQLSYTPSSAHVSSMTLTQKSVRQYLRGESEPLETRIQLDITETMSASADPEAIAVDRAYDEVRIDVTSGGEPVGADIVLQLENLIAGSKTRAYLDTNGQPVDYEWREVPNPQVRRAIYLLRDAHRLVTPRFMRDAINTGETWTYSIPMDVEQPALGVSARGEVEVANRLQRFEKRGGRRVAVIQQEFEIATEGTVEVEDYGDAPYTLEGSGAGVVRFDVDAGRVHTADLDFKRILSVEQEEGEIDQRSEISVTLR